MVAKQQHGYHSSIVMSDESDKNGKKLSRSYSDTTADSRYNSYVIIKHEDQKKSVAEDVSILHSHINCTH